MLSPNVINRSCHRV